MFVSSASRWREDDEGDDGIGGTVSSAADFLEFALRLKKKTGKPQDTVGGT